jgi:tRNA1Val (adenine37-N6)-methyltransferase
LKPFTFHYSQPDEYHFSFDSIEAAWRVAQGLIEQGTPPRRVLDLCAGVGVMGFELACFLGTDFELDFVEVQAVYQTHFEENRRRFASTRTDSKKAEEMSSRWRWMQTNYESLRSHEVLGTYDLILCNPPYFEVQQGPTSIGDFKARCRFFIDSSSDELWNCIDRVLAPGGQAFVLVRTDDAHGTQTLLHIERRFRYSGKVSAYAEIQGTTLIKIVKNQ